MMSDMETFTIRDLDRTPRKVLEACESAGVVQIRTREGKAYEIRPVLETTALSAEEIAKWRAGHASWLEEVFGEGIPTSQCDTVDRLLAGE